MQVKTKNLIVAALAVLLVSALWYRVIYSPMESKASKAKTSAHEAEITADNLRQAINGTTGSNKKNKAQDVPPETLRAAVPIETAEASFLRAVDTLRVTSGAEWQSITPSIPTPAGTVSSINVAITLQGTEDQVARYVAGLAGLKRVFVLDNLSITPSGSAAAAGSGAPTGHPGAVFTGDTMQAQISGRIFSQPTAAAASTTSGGTTGTSGSSTKPATGASAPTGPSAPTGVQNN